MKFSEWLKIDESARPVRYRPEIGEMDIKKSEVSVGDIVELGPETEYKGKKVNKIGRVEAIRGYEAIIKNLFTNKLLSVSLNDLYDKEELKGIRLTPSEEKQLSLLGGRKLWIKLSDRQYRKYKSQYQSKLKPIIHQEDLEDKPDSALVKMFSKSSNEREREPEKIKRMFSTEKEKTFSRPLGRFIKKDLFGEL